MNTPLKKIIHKVLKESYTENYMFFSNLKQMRRQIDMMLEMDPNMIEEILQGGHDWADDHISEAKTNMDQVFDFFKNEMEKQSQYVDYVQIDEGKKKKKKKKNTLCSRGINSAKAKYDVYPSAYANGHAVQVCKGQVAGLDGEKRCSGKYCSGKN
jgi:septation ring formation regulator EzrA